MSSHRKAVEKAIGPLIADIVAILPAHEWTKQEVTDTLGQIFNEAVKLRKEAAAPTYVNLPPPQPLPQDVVQVQVQSDYMADAEMVALKVHLGNLGSHVISHSIPAQYLHKDLTQALSSTADHLAAKMGKKITDLLREKLLSVMMYGGKAPMPTYAQYVKPLSKPAMMGIDFASTPPWK